MKTVKSTSIICTIVSAAIFCFLVLFTPVRVNAEQSYTPAAQDQPEELFSAYVDHVFYDGVEENSGDLYAASSDGMASSAGGMDDEIIGAASGSDISIGASNASRRETLSAADAYVYDVVYQAVCDIADGKRSSSEITRTGRNPTPSAMSSSRSLTTARMSFTGLTKPPTRIRKGRGTTLSSGCRYLPRMRYQGRRAPMKRIPPSQAPRQRLPQTRSPSQPWPMAKACMMRLIFSADGSATIPPTIILPPGQAMGTRGR